MNIGRKRNVIEFKRSTSELKEGIISISSILNKHGKGVLYFGVNDAGEVVGQEIGKDTERKVSREIASRIRPSCLYEVHVRNADDGRQFIEVPFSGTQAPYSAYGLFYERFADEDRQMSDSELERLYQSRQRDYSAWENANSGETIDDIDEARLKAMIASANECGRLRYEYSDAPSALGKLGLYNAASGRLTNAGRVLFSKREPVLLKLALYATETTDTFIRLNHFGGNIFECIDEGMAFILSSINYRVSFDGGTKRVEVPEIPQKALREILVNAFAHGCYYANTSFSIEIFSDRVSIYSPGLFPLGMKPESFAKKAAKPIMLNPTIATTLFRAELIESFGTGFEKTFKECKKAGVPFSYEDLLTGFCFTFHRGKGASKGERLSDTEQEVLSLLKECDYLTNEEIAERIGKTGKTVYRALKSLKERGLIRRAGSSQDGYWDILK